MTATDVPVSRPLPMTEFLIANDVPKQYRTAACAAFALWLEQLGDGNAPLAVLHLAEALKREQDRVAAVEALAEKWRYKGEFGWGAWQEGNGPDEEGWVLDQAAADIRAALSGGVV